MWCALRHGLAMRLFEEGGYLFSEIRGEGEALEALKNRIFKNSKTKSDHEARGGAASEGTPRELEASIESMSSCCKLHARPGILAPRLKLERAKRDSKTSGYLFSEIRGEGEAREALKNRIFKNSKTKSDYEARGGAASEGTPRELEASIESMSSCCKLHARPGILAPRLKLEGAKRDSKTSG